MSSTPPGINIINPTPPRPAGPFRLLYRGALSLPDSHLLLDGLTFAARLDHPASGHNLLQNPLALALESMRGRPSLRWMGPTKLTSIYMDETGGITMAHTGTSTHCHPHPNILREHVLPRPRRIPRLWLKVALGDSDGPETTEMIIFARPQAAAAELQLIVARITPAPPPPSLLRLPRPDDPTPRRPPIRFDRSSSLSAIAFAKKRTASVADLGSGVRLGAADSPTASGSGSFKIPEMPRSSKGKERAVVCPDDDVFGQGAVENKGKRKRDEAADGEMEKANKTIIKQSTIHLMSIPKTHPEYKDVYGAVYRGVGFALASPRRDEAVGSGFKVG
ncbi:hypothetical protein B0H17DRAFT_1206798 [Mycena rosella]|uniref:Sld7 C-terminal domain-containing protein n=1 Tax=Mycena rosella TaxID=1033263 RepID=A0AAD7D4E1_MYCRO|nr:hypothetical protein B0H17DRAFT_1206798 [Mycena rosella]